MRLKIYLARAIKGKTFNEVAEYYESMTGVLRGLGFDVLHAFAGKSYLRDENSFKAAGYTQPLSTDNAIKQRDRWMVGQADIVLVNLLDVIEVSIGCMFEICWAEMWNKHVIVVMQKENIHRHAFVTQSASVVFETMEEALDYLGKLAKMEI